MWNPIESLGAVPRCQRRLIWDKRKRHRTPEQLLRRRRGCSLGLPRPRSCSSDLGSGEQGHGEAGQPVPGDFLWARPIPQLALFHRLCLPVDAKANARLVRRTGARSLIGLNKAAMPALPTVAPVTEVTARVRLPRDYFVRMGSNDYSVLPQPIGKSVDVIAGRGDRHHYPDRTQLRKPP
ncbi:Mu transposase domain-containing protein [Paenarthrobacter sp. TA1.8]